MAEKSFAEHFVKDSDRLLLEHPAILIVDMLNDFCKPGGAMVLEGSAVIFDPISQLVEAFRKNRHPVIYVNDCHRPGCYDKEFEKRTPHCIDGTWGAGVIDELKPQEGDYCVKKRRFSGFFQTDLDLILRELGIQTVVVTGVVTNICVRSTCHDAFFRGYKVVVPKDCVRATAPREQVSTLWDIETHFGVVTNGSAVMAVL